MYQRSVRMSLPATYYLNFVVSQLLVINDYIEDCL